MKTLIFCAGAPQADLSVLTQQPFDLLVGVDAGANTLVKAGYIPDWAIGDFDSQAAPQICRQILSLPSEKADTDLEFALQHILSFFQPKDIQQIIILGALNGGRLDHLLANIWLAQQPRFAPWFSKFHFIERHNSVRFFQAGVYSLTREHNKKYLSFIGLTPIAKLTLQQVKYPIFARDYPHPTALISNEFLSNTMHFSFTQGILAALQTIDAA